MGESVIIELSEEQCRALYDLVEFRLVAAPIPDLMPELELDELMALAAVLIKLRDARHDET